MAACRIDADAASCTIKAGEDARRCPAIGLTNAITPDGKTAYVVNLIAGTVTPISTATNTPGRPAAVVKSSPGVTLDGIGIAPDGRTAYILNEIFEPASFPGTAIPLRTATNTLGRPITVGTAPSAIVFAR